MTNGCEGGVGNALFRPTICPTEVHEIHPEERGSGERREMGHQKVYQTFTPNKNI